MLGPMFSALSGLSNASQRLQNSANNVTNVNTPVDITEEIVDQIVSKVAFKANINVIKTNDDMLGSILDIKS
jgi:flagellar hook protein FlgE